MDHVRCIFYSNELCCWLIRYQRYLHLERDHLSQAQVIIMIMERFIWNGEEEKKKQTYNNRMYESLYVLLKRIL